MDLAAALSPATPSQLSRSVSATGGCESFSLPLLRWAMVPLSETLRLDNKEGLEEAAGASSSLFSKHTGGGRDLPARRGCNPITSKPSTVLQWTPSSFLCRGPKAFKVKNFSLHLFWNLGTTLQASLKYKPGLGSSQPCTPLLSMPRGTQQTFDLRTQESHCSNAVLNP